MKPIYLRNQQLASTVVTDSKVVLQERAAGVAAIETASNPHSDSSMDFNGLCNLAFFK
jgi:hypothetical protein